MTSVPGAPQKPRGAVEGLAFSRTELLIVAAAVAGLVLFGYADLHERFDEAHAVWRAGAEDAYVWLFAIVRAVPILWCRRYPIFGFAATLAGSAFAGAALAAVVGAPLPWSVWPWSPSSQLCVLAALVIAGWEVGRRRSIEMAAAYFLLTLFLETVRPGYGFSLSLGSVIGGSALAVGCVELLRDRRVTRQALAVQEERTEAERTRRTLLEERARIGRELHDVVAHHMSLIAVQAETAPFRITGQSPEAEAEFQSISAVSREALNDMRKLLGLLRADSGQAETAPQPRLTDVPGLVEEAGAGLEVVGDLDDTPPLIGLTGYRVVQESLSNARRHARGAEDSVRIARTEDEVRIEIRNGPAVGEDQQQLDLQQPAKQDGDQESGQDGDQDGEPAEGQGIAGMRERVVLVHGEIETGPTANGGFAVTATLPLETRA
ncbi:signal transduction histidine kinase [Catenulispora sp. GAS73]|uniref:sensor histidine kinase n=1 Tax=Catenulispora sp. GAS73 TaxID=3156269 RepID=UPI0035124D07